MKNLLTFFLCCSITILWAGDDPCSATMVSTDMIDFQTMSNVGAGDSGIGFPSCGNYQGDDFWLEFIAPTSGAVTIELEAGSITDAALNLYWGLCGGFQTVDLGCYEDFDCGAELMPKVTFDELIPGQSYFVKIWEEGGGTGTFGVRVSNPFQQEFVMSGTASAFTVGDFSCVQLTTSGTGQSGCAWYPSTIDFSQPFEQELSLNFGIIDGNGADGIAIIFQPNGTNACGSTGQGLGAQGIPQSWIVEFDTWNNGGQDLPEDHIAISINGNVTAPTFGPEAIPFNIEDGAAHIARITWDPVNEIFQVFFDDQLYISANYDIVNTVFGGNSEIYWGVTASTGAAFNDQSLCFLGITVTNSTSYSFTEYEVICQGNGLFVGGAFQTTEGEYEDVFIAQNGCDSTIITNLSVANVEAIAEQSIQLPCEDGVELMLDASLSSVGEQPSINWTTSDGTILSGQNTLTPMVLGSGTYNLSIIDFFSGCNDNILVEVLPGEMPIADAGAPTMLDCQTTTFQLDGTASSEENFYTYEWTTIDGTIASDTFSLTPTISAAGTYTLVVTNTNNDCSAEASVIITANQDVPTAMAIADASLNCTTNSLTIDGAGSSEGMNISYQWQSEDGMPIAGANELTYTADAAGIYTLVVSDNASDCSASFPVTISADVELPIAQIEAVNPLDCDNTSLLLNAESSSQGNDFTYAWTTSNGTIDMNEDSLNPTIASAGDYQLIVTNTSNTCTAVAEIAVGQNADLPLADAGANATLSCAEDSIELDGTNSDAGANISYVWMSLEGNIIFNTLGTTPTINEGGTYEIIVTNTDNNCTATDQVLVTYDTLAPQVELSQPALLTCNQTNINLPLNPINDFGNYSYSWTSSNGQIENGADTPNPEISAIGTYDLTITNTENACTTTLSVGVSEDTNPPEVVLDTAPILTCSNTEIDLVANPISGNPILYEWTSLEGNNITNETTANPSVNTEGTYNLLMTDTENGCTNTASISVISDLILPLAEAGDSQELDCNTNSIFLNGASAGNVTYQWTSQDGLILNDATTLNPEVNAAGTYEFVVTNLDNGCTASDEVLITQDNNIPIADAGLDASLSCQVNSLQLDASQSSIGANFELEWTSPDGNSIDDPNISNPTINQAGIYNLTITDLTNNCTAQSQVNITEDLSTPQFSLSQPNVLDCMNPSTNLLVNDLNPGNYTYLWSSLDGSINGALDEGSIEANSAGNYQVMVTNNENGCSTIATTEVQSNAEIPVFSLEMPDTLNCLTTEIELLSSTNMDDTNWTYEWTSLDGNFTSNLENSTILINSAGTYDLLVTDTQNDCATSQSLVVVENLTQPEIIFAQTAQLDCQTNSIEIDASASTGATTYLWTLPSGVSEQASDNPFLDASEAGEYQLVASNENSFCEAIQTITITEDIANPIAEIAEPALLTCAINMLQLDASTSSTGDNFVYEWTSPNASIAAGGEPLEISVSEPGIYNLLVSNTQNNCTASASITVGENINIPEILIAEPSLLTCAVLSANLDASNSAMSENLSYTWQTSEGNITSGEAGLSPEIDAPGVYTLTILNNENDCENTQSIEVFQDIENPIINIAPAEILDCENNTLILDANTSSSGMEFQYEWTTNDGNIIDNANQASPTISQAGTYELLITNINNTCTATQEIEIIANEELPLATIIEPDILNCAVDEIQIQANTIGSEAIEYLWTSADGNILEGATSSNPLVNEAGTYELLLTNAENACTSLQSVTILQDIAIPFVEAGEAELLTCMNISSALQAQISEGSEFTFEWETADGSFLSGTESLQPQVNQAGTYTLTVSNTTNFCTATDFVIVEQNENIPTALNVSATPPLCFGDLGNISFGAIEGGEGPFMYSIDGGMTFVQETFFENLAPANYNLYIEDVNACTLDTTLLIPDVQEVFVEVTPEIMLALGEAQTIDAFTNIPTNDIANIQWSPTDGLSCSDCLQPICSNTQDIIYTITISNTNGCTASASLQLRVDRAIDIYVPNAFSPSNEDGINDGFTIFSKEGTIANIRRLQVYDRWGNLVFENQNFQANDERLGWDGFFRGKALNPAVFTWFAEVELTTGDLEILKGDVTLME